jgi:predicted permease
MRTGLMRTLGRKQRYDDISVSIQEHIDERTEELIDEGMPREQAEQQARREFGNAALIEQRSREAWQWQRLETLLNDVWFALRRLARSAGFTVTVLLTLAIGIGANTAVFSVLNCVLLKPLRYPAADRLVSLHLDAPGAGGLSSFSGGLLLSPSMYFTFSEHNRSFTSMGIWFSNLANLTGVAKPDQVKTEVISGGVLETLDVPAAMGRWFNATDQDPRGAKTAMLSYGCWMRRFGGDRGVIGRTVDVDAVPREIVGVMPRGFRVMDRDFDLLLPMALDPVNEKLAPFGFEGMARLKPGVSLAQADADIARLVPVWMESWTNGPGTNSQAYYKTWNITPAFRTMKAEVTGNVGGVLWVVMATVGLVMLIACTNVANLLLVRAESRQHELAIRAALGAGRARIARELLLESVVLGLMGGVLSVGLAWAGLRLLAVAGPADLPRLAEIALDGRSLGFTLLLAVFSGLFFGAIPAWKYARSKTSLALGIGSRTASTGRERQRTRRVLVVAQVAMALVLLVSSLLMIRTFAALRNVDPGFADAANVQTLRISIPEALVADPVMVLRTENAITDQLAAIPGVNSAGFASAVPMEGFSPNWDIISVEGKRYDGEPPLRMFNYVAPGYFHTMGTRMMAGRDFNWDDVYGLRNNVVVSEEFARESWGSAQAAIGQRVKNMSDMPWLTVIGVVEDVRHNGVDEPAPPTIYWPALLNNPYTPDHKPDADWVRSAAFVVHSRRAGTQGFRNQLEQAVWKVNANLPVASIQTMEDIYGQSMARTSFTLAMLAMAGGMALALSIIGIYGVISYAVSQRTREIGIRLALGAQKSTLSWMFVRSALAMTAAGVVIGIGAAAGLTQLMRSLLFAISPLDPLTFVTVPAVLAGAALLASYLPARRAAAVDPVVSLRAE